MSDKTINIALTEREWDHIQLAVEETTVQLIKISVDRALDSMPYNAVSRAADRYESIADKIEIRLDEESDERMITEWKLEVDELGGIGGEVMTEEPC